METPGPILVAADFSRPARRAFELAVALAKRGGTALEIVHAAEQGVSLGVELDSEAWLGWFASQREEQEARLAAWCADAVEAGVAAASFTELGAASRVIPDRAARVDARLIVLGRRGAAGLSHVLLGSVSERVVHRAGQPVLVVPQADAPPAAPRRILVAVDFSDVACDALDVAVEWATALGCEELVLAHARPDPGELWLQDWSELAHHHRYPYDEAALLKWAQADRLANDHGLEVTPRIVDGNPDAVLLPTAEEHACDWIVLGRHGHSALAEFMMGSTTDRILKRSDRPVLVVPPAAGADTERSE